MTMTIKTLLIPLLFALARAEPEVKVGEETATTYVSDPVTESLSGEAVFQNELNKEFVAAIGGGEDVEARLDEHEARLDYHEEVLTEYNVRITDLQNNVYYNTEDIAALQSSVSLLESSVSGLQTSVRE
eukprot:Selendium_serpulae@DN1075_c0_g1_i1.p1